MSHDSLFSLKPSGIPFSSSFYKTMKAEVFFLLKSWDFDGFTLLPQREAQKCMYSFSENTLSWSGPFNSSLQTSNSYQSHFLKRLCLELAFIYSFHTTSKTRSSRADFPS